MRGSQYAHSFGVERGVAKTGKRLKEKWEHTRCCTFSNRCCCIVSIVVLVLLVVAVIFCVIHKPKIPHYSLDSFHANFDVSENGFKFKLDLIVNLTFKINNTNPYGFQYGNGTIDLFHNSKHLANASFGPGEIPKDGVAYVYAVVVFNLDDTMTSLVNMLGDLIRHETMEASVVVKFGASTHVLFWHPNVNVDANCDMSITVSGDLNKDCSFQ